MAFAVSKAEDKTPITGEDYLQDAAQALDQQPVNQQLPPPAHHQKPLGSPSFEGQSPPVAVPPSPSALGLHIQEPEAANMEYAETYMLWSLINCVFFCWPLGLFAICISSMIRSENTAGNIRAAKAASQLVVRVNATATAIGSVIIIAVVIWQTVF